MQKYKPIILVILDGWGLSPSWGGNALTMNNPKNINDLWRNYPHKILQALGAIAYGNIVGESRLGHLMIGAGRPVMGNHGRINKEIKSHRFYKNPALLGAFDWAKRNKSNLHLMGLISDGGVHADVDHLVALLEMAHRQEFDNVYIDAITDGTDTGPTEALKFIEKIERKISATKIGQFSSISGRYYAMDRDEHWDRIKKYYQCITAGSTSKFNSPGEAISASYRKNLTDEFIEPSVILDKKGQTHLIKDDDAVIFFNFREDRARQLSRVFLDPKFGTFLWRPRRINDLYFATFTDYQKNLPAKVAFPEPNYKHTLSEVLALRNFRQLKVAESEKRAHVTYFFNGGQETPNVGEERKIVSSPNVASYDQKPEMSAKALSKITLEAIKSKKYDFILVNFANVDMIAHTGNLLATGKAVLFLDEILGQISETTLKAGGALMVTADHGNAEQMVNTKIHAEREMSHTLNPVPFILVVKDLKKNLIQTSIGYQANTLAKIIQAKDTLADVAPTVLELMAVPKPEEMTGHSLLNRLE